MTNEDKIRTLVPAFQPLARNWLDLSNHWLSGSDHFRGCIIRITEAKRSLDYQAGLFSQGRKWIPSQKVWIRNPKERIVTHTMDSLNLKGEAFDYAIYDMLHEALSWPDPKIDYNLQMYMTLGEIAKDIGLWPGALWIHTEPDYLHISHIEE